MNLSKQFLIWIYTGSKWDISCIYGVNGQVMSCNLKLTFMFDVPKLGPSQSNGCYVAYQSEGTTDDKGLGILYSLDCANNKYIKIHHFYSA